jgi:acyl-CoA synthetase (AMP-forming)/AMP-acid ligase II
LILESAKILWDNWQKHADEKPDQEAVIHWLADEEPYRWTWGDLIRSAGNFAQKTRDGGVKPGEICALIMRHKKDFHPLYLGISLAGAIPAILAYPNPRLHPDKFRQGLDGMARKSGLDWILTERSLEDTVKPLVLKKESSIRGILYPLDWVGKSQGGGSVENFISQLRENVGPDDPCLLQHSSGTTGLQKAVVLSHRAVHDHVKFYGRSIDLREDDRIVSWLPLYHDMGLIAAYELPFAWGIPSIQIDPFEWVQSPAILLDAISREGGTLTWLPNFSYNFMADRIREEDLNGIRLDSLRMVINCAEPVREDSHDKFYERFSPYGFKNEALAACYAMAETVFAVTQTVPGARARTVAAQRDELVKGRFQPVSQNAGKSVKFCVSSGKPIDGCEVKIVDEEGKELPEGQVGEIVIQSVSLFDEYRNQPEKTAEVLKEGWYFSGDYGFIHEGECYVIGRKKDIIIVAGHNIAPEDVEDAVNEVEGVIPGRLVAFGVEDSQTGTEQVCVVAETHESTDDGLKSLKREVREAGMQIDVTIHGVYLVPPRWLYKSSSGKLCRKTNKARVEETFPDS